MDLFNFGGSGSTATAEVVVEEKKVGGGKFEHDSVNGQIIHGRVHSHRLLAPGPSAAL